MVVPIVDAMTALRNCALWSSGDNVPYAAAVVMAHPSRSFPRFRRGLDRSVFIGRIENTRGRGGLPGRAPDAWDVLAVREQTARSWLVVFDLVGLGDIAGCRGAEIFGDLGAVDPRRQFQAKCGLRTQKARVLHGLLPIRCDSCSIRVSASRVICAFVGAARCGWSGS